MKKFVVILPDSIAYGWQLDDQISLHANVLKILSEVPMCLSIIFIALGDIPHRASIVPTETCLSKSCPVLTQDVNIDGVALSPRQGIELRDIVISPDFQRPACVPPMIDVTRNPGELHQENCC